MLDQYQLVVVPPDEGEDDAVFGKIDATWVSPTVVPFDSTSPAVPSACLITLCTVEAASVVAGCGVPLLSVYDALTVYLPSGSALPAESVGVQLNGTVPADCAPALIVFTTVPAAFFTVIVRFDTELDSDTPNGDAAPPFTATALPGASTFVPISSAACVCWPAVSCDDSDVSDVFSCAMPLTVLICASCDVICELSTGLVGSWFCSCVTSSFRNVACRSLADVPLVDDTLLVFIVSVGRFDTFVPLLPIVVLEEVILGGLLSGLSELSGL
ncbi:hypothetical protein BC2230_70186 [Burkholderia cepacia]